MALTLTGCPDNPYKADTWIKKLHGSKDEAERAITELDNLGDPAAIQPLGELWLEQGKPGQLLQIIISLARPLSAGKVSPTCQPPACGEADQKNFTDYVETGRPASWDKAMPYLVKAVTEVDDASERSLDSARKASDAIGEAKLPEGLDALIELGSKPITKKLADAQVYAIRAIGKFDNDQKSKAAQALMKLMDRDPPPRPDPKESKEKQAAANDKYRIYLSVTAGAINSLGDLRYPAATDALVKEMYKQSELFAPIRRALIACGPNAEAAVRKVLAGTNNDINTLLASMKLDKYCGEKGELTGDQCTTLSAKDFYAAIILGDFYDPASVPDLLTALQKKPAPVYVQDDAPSPNTQYNAIFDALRKIGAPDAASAVHAIWADPKGDAKIRTLAVGAYAFVAAPGSNTDELGKIAADDHADDGLRQEASAAFARLSSNPADIDLLNKLAQKYSDAADKKRTEADGKPKVDFDNAQKVFDAAKKVNEAAADAANKVVAANKADDKTQSPEARKAATDAINAATKTKKDADAVFATAKAAWKEAQGPYRAADGTAKAYRGFQRMFQTHIARIVIAIKCKDDAACFAKTLTKKPDDAAKDMAGSIKDIDKWTADEKFNLLEAEVERAMIELGKRGSAASAQADVLLDALANPKDRTLADDRVARQTILLALPKIAKKPCATCEAKLDATIKLGEGKTTLGELNVDTQMLRNYYADGKTAPPPVEAPAK